MPITPGLKRALEAAALEEAAALKSRYVGRIQALLDAVSPALSALELSVGLGLDEAGRAKSSTVARWLSTAPRNLRAVPDEDYRALLDRLYGGQAVMALGPPLSDATTGPALRSIVFCEPWEAARLGPEWHQVVLGASPMSVPVVPATPPVVVSASPVDGDWSGGAASVSTPRVNLPLRAPVRRFGTPPKEVFIPPLGLGTMRLSTASRTAEGTPRRPDEAESVAVIRRALDLGLRLIDTADSYAIDDKDLHHNEHLIRRALGGWSHADREHVLVATKVGLARPAGRWAPNGRPAHLVKMAEQSLQALNVEALDLLQLHVKDPRVPYEESLGALADLYRQGKVKRLGVCNVSTTDLAIALRVLPEGSLHTVQNELNPFDTASARGVLAMTRAQDLTLLAHSPLGGHAGVHRVLKRDVLATIAKKHGLDESDSGRHQVVLAWLLSLGPHVIPVFGATRTLSVESSVGALQLELSDEDLTAIDQAFPKAAALRTEALPEPIVPGQPAPPAEGPLAVPEVLTPLPPPGTSEAEVVIVLGIPGAGKSTLVEPYIDAGYLRLNRDELGGKLEDLIPHLRSALGAGRKHVVLDNTYPTAKSRASVIAAAREAGVPVRCVWLDTTLGDARWNAVLRMLHRHGRLLAPDEIAALGKVEANTIPPVAQSIWLKNFEAPTLAEGFERVERRAFLRSPRPDRTRKGLLLDVDGTLRTTRSGEKYPRDPADVELLPHRREVLRRWYDAGHRLYFVSNQSPIASGKLTHEIAVRAFDRTIELLGLPVDEVAFCPHQAFPVACFCRKPMPGLAVMLIEKHNLSLADLVVVGDMGSDAELAKAVGARYVDAEAFFDPARGTGA